MVTSEVTVIVTTSPIPTLPSTAIIERAICSLSYLGLSAAQQIIVADGVNVSSHRQCSAFKSGAITPEVASAYEEYKKRLIALFPQAAFLEQTTRRGFARNVETALSMVTTPIVLILQHDYEFVTPLDPTLLLNLMLSSSEVNYVRFPSSLTRNLIARISSDTNQFSRDLNSMEPSPLAYFRDRYGIPLLPLSFWYDAPHLCKSDIYRQIFRKRPRVVKNFIEDSWGQRIRRDLAVRGMQGHADYGCFIHWSNEGEIRHINGRNVTIRAPRGAYKDNCLGNSSAWLAERMRRCGD